LKKIEFGMSLSTEDDPKKFIDLVRATERAGFKSIWQTDSGLEGRDCYPYLTLVAINTHKPTIGTGVTNLLSRNIGITANAIATVDEISGGRTILGLSAGGPWNLSALGIKAPVSPEYFRDQVKKIRSLLMGEKVSLNPKSAGAELFFKTRNPVPIFVAATGPKMLAVAGEVGDGVIVSTGVNDKSINFSMGRIKEGARRAKRDYEKIKLVNWTFLGVAKDSKTAIDSIRPLAMWSPALNPFWSDLVESNERDSKLIREANSKKHDFVEMNKISKLLSEEFILKFGIAGTVDECIEQIKRLSLTGIDQIAILTGEHGVGQDVKDVVELFGNEIIPHFE
jgi:5,10-methylenetetrahydromethanopterin reductase